MMNKQATSPVTSFVGCYWGCCLFVHHFFHPRRWPDGLLYELSVWRCFHPQRLVTVFCYIYIYCFLKLALTVLSNILANFSKHWVLHLQILSMGWLASGVLLRLLWDLLQIGKFGWRSLLLAFQLWRVGNLLCPRFVCLLFLWCMLCCIYSGEALGQGTIDWHREGPM